MSLDGLQTWKTNSVDNLCVTTWAPLYWQHNLERLCFPCQWKNCWVIVVFVVVVVVVVVLHWKPFKSASFYSTTCIHKFLPFLGPCVLLSLHLPILHFTFMPKNRRSEGQKSSFSVYFFFLAVSYIKHFRNHRFSLQVAHSNFALSLIQLRHLLSANTGKA